MPATLTKPTPLREAQALRPPRRQLPSQWAENNFYLSQGAAPEPGYYRGARAPYQQGIIDSQQDPKIKTTVFVSSTQVGKTLAVLIAMGFVIAERPGPSLLVQPTTAMAEEFSRERLMPAIIDSPTLSAKIDLRGRSAANTLLKKEFPGGFIALTGANAATGLAMRSIQNLWLDEIDRYPLAVGRDADPVNQAIKRTSNFWNSKIWQVSTPTVSKTSRILKIWELSDKRRFFVPCPHCDHLQHFVWEQVKYPGKDSPEAQPQLAEYECISCSQPISQSHRPSMLRKGRWIATEPNPKAPKTAGFHLNELYSPWRDWADVALDYETARKDPLQLQVWTNTSLGLGWDAEDSEQLQWERLVKIGEQSTYERGEVPPEVSILTAGVDVQVDRIEVSTWGWGKDNYYALIDHQTLMGEPTQDAVWQQLEDYLSIGYDRGEINLKSSCTFIDSGNWTNEIYAQVKKRKSKNWHPIKGRAGDRVLIAPPSAQEVTRKGKKIKTGINLRVLGVDRAKEHLYQRLSLDSGDQKSLKFPRGMDMGYYEGLASEVKVKKHKMGQPYFQWEKLPGIARNEPWDCLIYAYCAAVLFGIERNQWAIYEKRLAVQNLPKTAAAKVKKPVENWVTDI